MYCALVQKSVYVLVCGRQLDASPFILSQYRRIAVISSFCTAFNRDALSFHPALPAFVLTNKERNTWIKSFNYPCKRKTVCVCVCLRERGCDIILPTLYHGREVVAMVTAVGAWRNRERESGTKQRKEDANG